MSPTIAPNCAYRIKSDIKEIMKSPPMGICGVPDDNNFLMFHAIIVGPDGTPYEKGFFYFVIEFPVDYPMTPPAVKFMTTGGGQVRLNPNLYACGKVCLSILGTWFGPEWSPAQTLSSLLVSIQSLLNEFPYYNEPAKEKKESEAAQYNEIIYHESLRVAVVGMVRNDFLLSLPVSLQLYIQQQFVKNIGHYERLASDKRSLTGNIMKDPLYQWNKQETFNYSKLLDDLLELKKQLHITDSS